MGMRRDGREAAIQFLFQCDMNLEGAPDLLEPFWKLREPGTRAMREFAESLISGVLEHRVEIDARIKKYVANYELNRIAVVDRNILRLAIYEMLHCPETPPVVSINEAIEIAKRYGAEESGRFVNGVLDRIRGELNRPARAPAAS
jgi:transcription antitermination protein NusB